MPPTFSFPLAVVTRVGRIFAEMQGMTTEYLPWKVLSADVNLGVGTDGWILDEEVPEDAFDRAFTYEVNFAAPFASKPVVHVGLTGFDIDRCSSARLTLAVERVTTDGFIVRLTTWRSSRVYGARFQWIAIGA